MAGTRKQGDAAAPLAEPIALRHDHTRRGVKRGDVNPIPTGNLIREIDAETAAIDARAAELSLYRMWATHRLVPDAHIGLLMNVSRDGGVQ